MTQGVAVVGDSAEFARDAESLRRELLAHCYRMVGSVHEAEDLVQETYLRAWRSYSAFEGRSSIRTWLYRIATNVCLTALRDTDRRVLPSGLAGPNEPDSEVAEGEVAWLEPMPDALVDPAAVFAAREGMRLALIASLQHLPARQRAVLILRDVLAFPAAEVATILGISTVAVKSILQRARARLADVTPEPDDVVEPTSPQARALLDQYIAAFENADTAALERVLRQDAALETTGSRTWFAGLATCMPFLVDHRVLGVPGDWRMIPATANGQPAAVAYHRDDQGRHQAFGVAVLTATATGIARITVFADPGLPALFGHPRTLPAPRRQ